MNTTTDTSTAPVLVCKDCGRTRQLETRNGSARSMIGEGCKVNHMGLHFYDLKSAK